MSDSVVRAIVIVLLLSLGGATVQFLAKSRRLAAELETAAAAHERERAELEETIRSLRRKERELADSLRKAESELDALRARCAALTEQLSALAAALEASASAAQAEEPAELAIDEAEVIEVAALAAAEIAAASAVPFILFEDLPPEYQEELAQHRDHALFIRYPPNRWGKTSIGTVMVHLKTPEGVEWLPLDPYHQPLLRRLAELTYFERVAEEERIDELIREGQGTWYPDRESARAVQGSLTVRTSNRETGAWVRTDPTTGETWMGPGLLVLDAPRLQRLREQRQLVASVLLGGRSGGFSAGFRQK